MRFEKISENKLKIILEKSELPDHKSLQDIMSSSSNVQNSMLAILEQAEKSVGFYTTDYKIKIDARTINSKECMFYVTKLSKLKKEKNIVKPNKTYKSKKINCSVYKFDSFDDICNFFQYVENIGVQNIEEYAKECKIYAYNEKYYLVFNKINHEYKNVAVFNSSIIEFSKFHSSKKLYISVLEEKAKKILDKDVIKACRSYYKIGV